MLALALAASLSAAGCGGDSSGEDAQLSEAGLVDISRLPDPVLTAEDLEQVEAGSPQRAYLTYWRDAQFQDWASVTSRFAPGLLETVGFERMIGGLRSQAAAMRVTEPAIVAGSSSGPGLTSLRYAIVGPDGGASTQTAVLRKRGSGWEIVYDSFLDGAIGAFVAGRAQARIDPTAPNNSLEAERLGGEAAQLQSRYLEQLKQGG